MQKKWHTPLDKWKKCGIICARRGNHVRKRKGKRRDLHFFVCILWKNFFEVKKNMKQKIVRIVEWIRSYGILAIGIVRRIVDALQKKLQALENELKALVGRMKRKSAA